MLATLVTPGLETEMLSATVHHPQHVGWANLVYPLSSICF